MKINDLAQLNNDNTKSLISVKKKPIIKITRYLNHSFLRCFINIVFPIHIKDEKSYS